MGSYWEKYGQGCTSFLLDRHTKVANTCWSSDICLVKLRFSSAKKLVWSITLTGNFSLKLNFYSTLIFKSEITEDWLLIKLLHLLSVISILPAKQWNRLFCRIHNCHSFNGIFFVWLDCFLVGSGLVSDLTSYLLIRKTYLQSCILTHNGLGCTDLFFLLMCLQ